MGVQFVEELSPGECGLLRAVGGGFQLATDHQPSDLCRRRGRVHPERIERPFRTRDYPAAGRVCLAGLGAVRPDACRAQKACVRRLALFHPLVPAGEAADGGFGGTRVAREAALWRGRRDLRQAVPGSEDKPQREDRGYGEDAVHGGEGRFGMWRELGG